MSKTWFVRLAHLLGVAEPGADWGADDLDRCLAQAQVIAAKPFLRRAYADFYAVFQQAMPVTGGSQIMVELGSGGGGIRDVLPQVITTERYAGTAYRCAHGGGEPAVPHGIARRRIHAQRAASHAGNETTFC